VQSNYKRSECSDRVSRKTEELSPEEFLVPRFQSD
jgi:hypothetical protein